MRHKQKLVLFLLVLWIVVGKEASLADETKYHDFIRKVAEAILQLKESHPQLAEFTIDGNADLERLRIDYAYHTRQPEQAAGWRSGVPNPDPDGVWFYIDLHDKDSVAQIHTQPVAGAPLQFGDKMIGFLILEGETTNAMAGELSEIMKQNGATSVYPQ